MRIPPLNIQILLESNPLKSRILVRRLAVRAPQQIRPWQIFVGKPFRGEASCAHPCRNTTTTTNDNNNNTNNNNNNNNNDNNNDNSNNDNNKTAHLFGTARRPISKAVHVLSSKQRDPNPSKNSLIRKQCCKRRMESLM